MQDHVTLFGRNTPTLSRLPDFLDFFFGASLACLAHKAYKSYLAIDRPTLVGGRLATSTAKCLDPSSHSNLLNGLLVIDLWYC